MCRFPNFLHLLFVTKPFLLHTAFTSAQVSDILNTLQQRSQDRQTRLPFTEKVNPSLSWYRCGQLSMQTVRGRGGHL